MASLFSPVATSKPNIRQDSNLICFSPLRPISKSYYFWSCTNHAKRINTIACSSFINDISTTLDHTLTQLKGGSRIRRYRVPRCFERRRCCVHCSNKVKVGVQGAAEFADYEEWFNYRLSRAAPETCAEFFGSFVAEKSNSRYTKGKKWLVWKFEVLGHLKYILAEIPFHWNYS